MEFEVSLLQKADVALNPQCSMTGTMFPNQLTSLRRRNNHAFLSHAHVDVNSVERLKTWLELAGLNVWYDLEKVAGGKPFPEALAEGINDSQSVLIAISKSSIQSGWVRQEFSQALVHQGTYSQFPVIPIRLEDVELPRELIAHSAVDAFDGELSLTDAAKLLRSIHGLPDLTPSADTKSQVIQFLSEHAGETVSPLEKIRVPILYVTCGWRGSSTEVLMRTDALQTFSREGFQLIGDAEDHASTDRERISALMEGCSGHLILLPCRNGAKDIRDNEYKSILKEIGIAKQIGLKQFCIFESGVSPPEEMSDVLEVDFSSEPRTASSFQAIEVWAQDVHGQTGQPQKPSFVFVATDYEDLVVKDSVVRHISQVTGLPCIKGSDFGGQSPSRKIEAALRNAAIVISNVVSRSDSAADPIVNWNTCIEVGIALGARTPIQIIARRQPDETWAIKDKLPFMLRDHSIQTYTNDQMLMALIHKSTRPFRRRVLGR